MLYKKFIFKNYRFLISHFSENLYVSLYGLARTIIGLSLLLTLIFNSWDTLFLQIDGLPCNQLLKIDLFTNKFNFFLLLGLENIKIMYYLSILVMIIVVSGFFPMVFCLLHWWIQFSFINSSSCVDGGDQIASNLCLLMIPIFLFDTRRWHWSNYPISKINFYKLTLSNVIFKLIRLQMCIIYFHAAVGKFDVAEWKNGTAIYYWVNCAFFKMSPNLEPITMFLFSNPVIMGLCTWGTMLIELLLAFGIVASKSNRKYYFYLGLFMHFMFMLYFGLVSFFLSMAGGLIFYYANSKIPLKKLIIWKSQK
jgi:antimicrobial peptide system SdpB family protein